MTIKEALFIERTWPKPGTCDKKNNKLINTLHPLIRIHAANAINQCYGQDIKLTITGAYRTHDEMCRLYGQGRPAETLKNMGVDPLYSKPKNKRITNEVPKNSMFGLGLAIKVDIINDKVKKIFRNNYFEYDKDGFFYTTFKQDKHTMFNKEIVDGYPKFQ